VSVTTGLSRDSRHHKNTWWSVKASPVSTVQHNGIVLSNSAAKFEPKCDLARLQIRHGRIVCVSAASCKPHLTRGCGCHSSGRACTGTDTAMTYGVSTGDLLLQISRPFMVSVKVLAHRERSFGPYHDNSQIRGANSARLGLALTYK
jgi:hypothetical protein